MVVCSNLRVAVTILALIDRLSFKSLRSHRLASGLAYGPHPRQRLDLYAPRGATKPLGVIVFIYGGSWAEGDRGEYSFVGRYLAARGYVVAIPDYRVIPEVEYPGFIEDTAEATRWVLDHVAQYGGDPGRLILAGHSAGAYNAVMASLDPRYGLAGRLNAIVGLSGPYDFFPFDVDITRRTFGAVPHPETTQPIPLVGPDSPPMFLATGDADTLVYPRNTVALAAALREAGVPVEEHHYARVGHPGLLLSLGSILGGRKSFVRDLDGFLARALK
jgi:acetyl esterase/lipase